MLTKETPNEIRTTLRVRGQGVEKTLMLTFHNHDPEKYEEFIKDPANLEVPEGVSEAVGIAHINAIIVLFLVKSFDDGTDSVFPLNRDGLIDLERHWPGTLFGIHRGYHQARAAAVEKN